MSYDRPRQRRPLYAPPPPRRHQHGLLTYWVPLIVTGTIAIGGLAAWIWSERREHEDDEHYPPSQKPPQPPPGPGGPYPTQGSQPYPGPPPAQGPPGASRPPYEGPLPSQSAGPQGGPPPPGGEAATYYGASRSQEQHTEQESQTFFGQVRGAMRRTPSPQQIFDHASKQVTAGIAAAGSALGSIMEDPDNGHAYPDERAERRDRRDDREGFSDHERWSEEADEKRRVGVVEAESERRAAAARVSRDDKGKGKPRRTVAVVISADSNMDGKLDEEDVLDEEHASILSHLPPYHNPETTDLFVLIYAPGLPRPPPLNYRPRTMDIETASNLGSSYSQINTPAHTPGSELQSISPRVDAQDSTAFPSPGRQFDLLYQQALALVDDPSKILCFTHPAAYVHILRQLRPSMAYVSDLLAGHDGQTVVQLRDYVGHTVLALGDDGTGGLADTETEDESARREKSDRLWYEHSPYVGRGKPLEVVDASRMGEDWAKRVGGRE